MATLRGTEAARLQSELQQQTPKTYDLKKYREVAPQVTPDEVIIELIERHKNNDVAIFAEIENLWHGLSDERAVIGNEWETNDKGRKGKKKIEIPERGGGRGRGKSAPPREGRGAERGGRGGGGRGQSAGRSASFRTEGKSEGRPTGAPGTTSRSTNKTTSVPTIYPNGEEENNWPEVDENVDDKHQQTPQQQTYEAPTPSHQEAHSVTKVTWASMSGLSLAQKLKLSEEQKKLQAAQAAQAAAAALIQQQLPQPSESDIQEGVNTESKSHRSRNRKNSTKGGTKAKPPTAASSELQEPVTTPSVDSSYPTENANIPVEEDPIHQHASISNSHHESDADLDTLELPRHSIEELTESLDDLITHENDANASGANEISSSTAPQSTSTSNIDKGHASSASTSSTQQPYLNMGKWEAPLEAVDRSAFQFGSFGTFDAPDVPNTSSAWGNVSVDSAAREEGMVSNVWDSVPTSTAENTLAASATESSLLQHQLEEDNRFVEAAKHAPPPGLSDIDSNSNKQQTVQRGGGSLSGISRKDEDSGSKQQAQPQQIQQTQQYQSQPVRQNQHSAGAPPGLPAQQNHISRDAGAAGSIGSMVGSGLQSSASIPPQQGQAQVPYYGLDPMPYMHPYVPIATPPAAVGTLPSTTAAAAGSGSHSAGNQQAPLQQQQSGYPPPPGMAAMGPYGATAYNPAAAAYFYNQQAYYYGNANAPNFYGRGGQGMYGQPPRGPYVGDPYSSAQAMGGPLYPAELYGQPGMGGQFGDSLYGGMPMQGGHQSGNTGVVGGGNVNVGKGTKGAGSGGNVPQNNPSHGPGGSDHGGIGHPGHVGYGVGANGGYPNPYNHGGRDAQQAAAQWNYGQPQQWSQQQQMMQQQQFLQGGGSGGGFNQQPGGRHDGGQSRAAGSGGSGVYGSSYGNRGSGASGGGQGGGGHQSTW